MTTYLTTESISAAIDILETRIKRFTDYNDYCKRRANTLLGMFEERRVQVEALASTYLSTNSSEDYGNYMTAYYELHNLKQEYEEAKNRIKRTDRGIAGLNGKLEKMKAMHEHMQTSENDERRKTMEETISGE